jgi:transcriptional regulator with XRE-family HTH domain
MIKNERQYRITKAQAERFTRALELAKSEPTNGETHPLLLKAEGDALRSQLADLQAQIEEYDALQSGQVPVPDLASFIDLPNALIKVRIAMGLSQRGLADRLGLKEQQIQRYEATGYTSASLSRIQEVIQALGVKLDDAALEHSFKPSRRKLFRRLKEVGLDPEFILKRLLPGRLAAVLQKEDDEGADNVCLQAAGYVGRIYSWKPTDIFGMRPLALGTAGVGGLRFKLPARVDERRVSAYTVYAHYLALVFGQATEHLPPRDIPIDPYKTREQIIGIYGSTSLEHVLRYVWGLGVPVIPLDDPGVFHGACFRENGRNIIVVKQKILSQARWAFDVLHELWHAAQEPYNPERTAIEVDDILAGNPGADEERVASQFAGAVLLGSSPQDLAERCLEEAGHDLRKLKAAVQRVGDTAGVPVDSLANYLAFRLSLEGENWWGAATNLQVMSGSPWRIARDILIEHVDFSKLAEPEQDLVRQALAPWEVKSHVAS